MIHILQTVNNTWAGRKVNCFMMPFVLQSWAMKVQHPSDWDHHTKRCKECKRSRQEQAKASPGWWGKTSRGNPENNPTAQERKRSIRPQKELQEENRKQKVFCAMKERRCLGRGVAREAVFQQLQKNQLSLSDHKRFRVWIVMAEIQQDGHQI